MHIVYTHNHTSQRLYTTRLYTPIIRPTYTQRAHTDIHTSRPERPEIRDVHCARKTETFVIREMEQNTA